LPVKGRHVIKMTVLGVFGLSKVKHNILAIVRQDINPIPFALPVLDSACHCLLRFTVLDQFLARGASAEYLKPAVPERLNSVPTGGIVLSLTTPDRAK
jgi:hypothetical protein